MAGAFSLVFISRPLPEARELAALLEPLGLAAIVQPAFEYLPVPLRDNDPGTRERLESAGPADLLVFTSPRAVEHGLSQVPRALLSRPRIAAIGPSTGAALAAAGLPPTITAHDGYTSEALLEALANETAARAFILAAPGGREALFQGLTDLGWDARTLMVYRSEPATLDPAVPQQLTEASHVLSVWTSGNAMKSLAQRLPPAAWYRLCRGEWLVISERLRRLARAYGPSRIHLASGPGNRAILAAVRGLL